MFNKKFKLTNTALFNHINRNVVHPTVTLNSSEQREVSSNVEIVEVKTSSNESEETNNEENYNLGNAWSYISHDFYADEDSYRTNMSARERSLNNADCTNGTVYVNNEPSSDQIYPSFYSLDRDYTNNQEFVSYNNRYANCFTIPNKFGTPSSSSDEQNRDLEVIHCSDVTPDRDYWNTSQESFNNEVYFSKDLQTDKRTIWIYSFKNNHILSENDYVLTNLPSKDSSSCNSSTDELDYEAMNESNSCRIATPIPYIPRLNLNLTLPTVTEVTEPIKPTSLTVAEINNTEQFNSFQKTPNNIPLNKDNTPSCSPRSKLINLTAPSPRKIFKSTSNLDENQIYNEPEIIFITNNENNTSDHQMKQHQGNRLVNKSNESSFQEPYTQKLSETTEIQRTEPLEKLEGNWIGEEKGHDKPPIIYEYDLTNENIEENAPDANHDADAKQEEASNLFITNIPLLQTAESNESKSRIKSPPSLNLSIISDVNTRKIPWFKKLFRCIKCFKKG